MHKEDFVKPMVFFHPNQGQRMKDLRYLTTGINVGVLRPKTQLDKKKEFELFADTIDASRNSTLDIILVYHPMATTSFRIRDFTYQAPTGKA